MAEDHNNPKHEGEQGDHPIDIVLDGKTVTSPHRTRTGLQIRELGEASRVAGFSTVLLHASGKKDRTIRDDESLKLHTGMKFETVPSEGGPGASH